jgi:hypothetical protein
VTRRALACALLLAGSPAFAAPDPQLLLAGSRNAAASYVATVNFIVGRMARECREVLGKPATWVRQPAEAWRKRNRKYWDAQLEYMSRQFGEAFEQGGIAAQERLMKAYDDAVRTQATAATARWLVADKAARRAGCERFFQALDAGRLDIGRGMGKYEDLEALVRDFPVTPDGTGAARSSP